MIKLILAGPIRLAIFLLLSLLGFGCISAPQPHYKQIELTGGAQDAFDQRSVLDRTSACSEGCNDNGQVTTASIAKAENFSGENDEDTTNLRTEIRTPLQSDGFEAYYEDYMKQRPFIINSDIAAIEEFVGYLFSTTNQNGPPALWRSAGVSEFVRSYRRFRRGPRRTESINYRLKPISNHDGAYLGNFNMSLVHFEFENPSFRTSLVSPTNMELKRDRILITEMKTISECKSIRRNGRDEIVCPSRPAISFQCAHKDEDDGELQIYGTDHTNGQTEYSTTCQGILSALGDITRFYFSAQGRYCENAILERSTNSTVGVFEQLTKNSYAIKKQPNNGPNGCPASAPVSVSDR